MQCKLTWITVPIVEIRQLRRARAMQRQDAPGRPGANGARAHEAAGAGGGRGRQRGRGRGRVRAVRRRPLTKKALAKLTVYKQWPVYLPRHMARALQKTSAEGARMLCLALTGLRRLLYMFSAMVWQPLSVPRSGSTDPDWSDFWEKAKAELWGRLLCLNPLNLVEVGDSACSGDASGAEGSPCQSRLHPGRSTPCASNILSWRRRKGKEGEIALHFIMGHIGDPSWTKHAPLSLPILCAWVLQ